MKLVKQWKRGVIPPFHCSEGHLSLLCRELKNAIVVCVFLCVCAPQIKQNDVLRRDAHNHWTMIQI